MMIHLRIGGFTIALNEPENRPITHWPVPMYEEYLAKDIQSPNLHFSISVVHALPAIAAGELVFDAQHGHWRLYRAGAEYFFESLDPMTLLPRCRAMLAGDFTAGQVWLCGHSMTDGMRWNPLDLLNPLVTVCLLTRLTRSGGLLLHAAGVLSDGGVWVFTGDSGAGKSTLSGWCRTHGMQVFNDERIIITQTDDGIVVWGTPWVGTEGVSLNRGGPLVRLHSIRHATQGHTMRPLSSSEASQLILRQCTIPHWDPQGLQGMLGFLHRLITETDCVDLAFEKNPNVLDYLRTASTASMAALS